MKLTENAESLLKDFYCRENESTWDEVCRRVARAVASSEELAAYWEEEFYNMINNLCFLPSSPCFLNADVNNPGQLSSCFIISLQDNIESIYKAKQECAKIFQKNGGVGFNISVLRPRNAPVETSKGTSCGVVGFMEEFNLTADIVTRGNKRKGAMKIDLNDWHPDLLEFIKCKDDPTNFEFMNISVSLSDDFMIAVEEDLVWTFLFPDYHKMKTIYDEEWDGDLDSWIDKGYPVKSYGEIPAREIYNIIMKQAHKNGEPGVSFRDTMNKANPNPTYGSVNSTNPCAEFASIPYNSCNLGSINLSKFVTDHEFEWDNFTAVVQKAMRFLDDMITVNKLPFDKLDYITKNLRSVGMGVMGLADCLYQLKIPYGSNAALLFVDRLLKEMYDECISTSNSLAEEKGTYPWYEWSIYDEMNFKVRNSNFLSIAPNGTISIIANTSGGIEPQFGLVYKRRTHEDKIYYFVNPYFEEALNKRGIKLDESRKQEIYNNHGSCQNLKWVPADLQEVFVIASDLTPLEHLNIATTAQKIVDLSISKTINLPNDCTVEDIADVYLKAWQDGLKGVTVYRDGSRPDQVLSTAKTKNEKNAEVLDKREGKTRKDFGERLSGATYQKHVACGKLYITINKDQEGNPVEIFVTTGKSGGCTANAEESGRLASLALRHGVPVEQVIKTIKGIRCGACLNAKGSKIKQIDGYSCGDVLAKTLMQELTNKTQDIAAATACPECGSTELLSYEGGCKVCHNCGWSKCG